MSAAQNPFDVSGMAANLGAPAGNPQPHYHQQQQQQQQQQQPQYQQPQYQQKQPMQQQQYQQPPAQQQLYQQPPAQQQQYQHPPAQQQYQQPPPQQQQQQLVVAAQPSNPYAGMVAPQPAAAANPWDAAPVGVNSSFVVPPPTRASTASASSFDPFAAPPSVPAPVPQQQQQAHPPAPAPAVQDPWAAAAAAAPPAAPQQPQYQAAPVPAATETQIVPAQPPQQQQAYNQGPYGDNNLQIVPSSGDGNDGDKAYMDKNPRNPYSNILAQQVAGSNASGLPKAHLVGKKGFVLSRISFRTIVMKKWKQSYWVQYGGHTMLWFRSKGDFDDWLNNPYHTQMQRNFLIKLAINFVHDLYKPNVRGYQVTQCRTKPYGKNKVVRQFKLERWMDYGPTIAAAFGSYDPKEVDACREAIVECMKNTPLDNGIRATGAVKEHHERQQQEEWRKSQESREASKANGSGSGAYQNYSLGNGGTNRSASARPTSQSFDLLAETNLGGHFDDSASVPPTASAGALVPAVNPSTAYPGAPTPYYGAQAAPQQQYPAPVPAADPWGAEQIQQQQYQQQQARYPAQTSVPAFAQPHQAEQGGYPYQQQQQQQQQQQHPGGYPAASYPVPTQQF